MLKFIAVLSLVATASTQAATITATRQSTVYWAFDEGSFPRVDFSVSEMSGVFQSNTFSFTYFVDVRPIQTARAYGAILGSQASAVKASTTYLRAGETIDGELTFESPSVFLRNDNLVNNAVEGSDNFLAIRWEDSSAQYHYGWLQFQLGTYSDGAIAISYLGGDVNLFALTGATAGVASIPEPSTLVLIGSTVALLPLLRRFRRAE